MMRRKGRMPGAPEPGATQGKGKYALGPMDEEPCTHASYTHDSAMTNMPAHIYIVDDEPSIRAAYARLMRSSNMDARTFCTVEEFLSADVSDEHACVLSDIKMPGSSGLSLPGLLEKAGRHLPVIFVTAHDTPDARDMAQRAGAAAFFRKPVDGQALLDAIEWALGRTRGTPTRG